MLSYQHGFHAGNFADVHKHLILLELVEYLQEAGVVPVLLRLP